MSHFSGNYTSRLRATLWDNGIVTYPQLQYALAQGSSVYSKQLPNPYYGVFSESFPGGCGESATIQALALLLPWSQYCGNAGSAPPVGIYNAPIGKNWYNGLEVKLTKHSSHGLTLNLAYTYSKNMDGSGYQNGYPYQDANEVHWISQFDRTHVLAMTGVYDLPVGNGRTFLSTIPKYLDYAIGGWTLGWSFAAQSGTPLNVNNGFNYTCPFAPPHGTSVQAMAQSEAHVRRVASAACRISAAPDSPTTRRRGIPRPCAPTRFRILICHCRRTSRSPKKSTSRCAEKPSTRLIPCCWVGRTTHRPMGRRVCLPIRRRSGRTGRASVP